MRRLAIIDLAGGQQPIHNEDRTKWIVFNGEIYNYRELRDELEKRGHKFYTNSDTEAVIHLYDEFGAGLSQASARDVCVRDLGRDGQIAFSRPRSRREKAAALFASAERRPDLRVGIQALLEHPSISRDVDHDAIDSYLSYLCVPAPHDGVQGRSENSSPAIG